MWKAKFRHGKCLMCEALGVKHIYQKFSSFNLIHQFRVLHNPSLSAQSPRKTLVPRKSTKKEFFKIIVHVNITHSNCSPEQYFTMKPSNPTCLLRRCNNPSNPTMNSDDDLRWALTIRSSIPSTGSPFGLRWVTTSPCQTVNDSSPTTKPHQGITMSLEVCVAPDLIWTWFWKVIGDWKSTRSFQIPYRFK